MYELDPKNPETLYNAPSPEISKWFVDKLTEIGGKQLDGRSNLRVVWGQEERRFACGANRMKYPTSFAAEKADYQFRLVSVETGEGTPCNYEEFMEAKKRYDAVDPDIKFIPQFKVKRQVEWIGIPRFVIEQFKPSVMIKDTPAAWEAHRYGWWFNPETGRNEWTDLIGPFPYEGRYEFFMMVKEDDGTNFGKYKAPSQREIELIQAALRAREEYVPLAPEVEVKHIIEAKEEVLRKSEAELSDAIANSLAPHVNRMYDTQVKFYQSEKGK